MSPQRLPRGTRARPRTFAGPPEAPFVGLGLVPPAPQRPLPCLFPVVPCAPWFPSAFQPPPSRSQSWSRGDSPPLPSPAARGKEAQAEAMAENPHLCLGTRRRSDQQNLLVRTSILSSWLPPCGHVWWLPSVTVARHARASITPTSPLSSMSCAQRSPPSPVRSCLRSPKPSNLWGADVDHCPETSAQAFPTPSSLWGRRLGRPQVGQRPLPHSRPSCRRDGQMYRLQVPPRGRTACRGTVPPASSSSFKGFGRGIFWKVGGH